MKVWNATAPKRRPNSEKCLGKKVSEVSITKTNQKLGIK
jgi:hypothetical protein